VNSQQPTADGPARRKPGTARSALQHRHFRLLFIGAALSNVGTWMQNFVLPAYLDVRTGSAALVGLLVFAQLGPQLFGSVPAGVLADRVNRRNLVLGMQFAMMTMSVLLAVLAGSHAPLWTIFAVQLTIGVANTTQAPAFSASLPMLVPREDLPGAVSLTSAMINGSRIAGPALAALLGAVGLELWHLFYVNAATYMFLMIPLYRLGLPRVISENTARGWRALTTGVRIARRRGVLGRVLISMSAFSMLSLPYIGLFPSVARLNLGIAADGSAYKILYVIWGSGAFAGALSVGTIFSSSDRHRMIRTGYLLFALALALFAVVSNYGAALAVSFALGFVYFQIATTMSTELQHNLREGERASVMPLWFMSFGGSIPIGNLIFGPLMDALGARWTLLIGATAAAINARWCDLSRLRPTEFLDESEHGTTQTGPSRLH
jgi:MFS family permease